MSTQHMTIKKFARASIAVLFATGTAHAVTYTYYFDVNSATTGSGVTNGGVYNWSGAYWTTNNTGTSTTIARAWNQYADPLNVNFVATADAGTTNYALNFMSGNNWINVLTVNSGNLTINEPSDANMVLNSSCTWTVLDGASLVITPSANSWGALNMNGNLLTMDVQGTATASVAGVGNSGNGLTKNGTGTLLLSRASTHTGVTTINTGTLQLGDTNAVQSSTLTPTVNNGLAFSAGVGTFNVGALAGSGNIVLQDTSSGAVTLSVGSKSTTTTYSGVLSGSGSLTKVGSGTLTLSKAKTYTGVTTINGGILELSSSYYQGSVVSGTFYVGSGSVFRVGGTLDYYKFNNVTVEFTSAGGGTLRAPADTSLNWYLDSAMTIRGNGGSRNVFDTSVSGNRLNLNGNNLIFDVARGTDSVSDLTVSAVLFNTGSITKNGTGILTLSGTNTYTGTTTVSNGTLRIDGNSSSVTRPLTVASGAALGGNGSYGGNITLNNGANLNCELNPTDSTLVCNGQLSFTNLAFTNCTFTVVSGAGYPPYRRIPLIEAASLGTTTFANTEGTIAGVPAKLYLKGKILMLDVGYTPGTLISIF